MSDLESITLGVNIVKTPIKRYRLPDWIYQRQTKLYTAYKKPTLNKKTQISKN